MELKISFDFDSTLSEEWVQNFALALIPIFDIWVVTSRSPGNSHNTDVYKVTDRLGISRENIIFTDGGYKWSSLDHYGINIHFDDMEDEILEINNKSKCKGVLIGLSNTEELWYLFYNKKETNEIKERE